MNSLRRKLAPLASLASLAAITLALPHCARDVMLDGTPLVPTADASEPTLFTPPPDAGDGSLDAPAPSVPMCIATECPYPWATCSTDGKVSDKCAIDLSIDNENCGACGNACPQFPVINMFSRCANGTCMPFCTSPNADCNQQVEDGCEVDTDVDPNNCGACGNKCPAGVECIQGQCGCPVGQTKCAAGCVDTKTNNENCGACGNVCDYSNAPPLKPNTTYVCHGGTCGHVACVEHYADCNQDPNDGCEVFLLQPDPQNCGACGKVCAPGLQCRNFGGRIACDCDPGETTCEKTYHFYDGHEEVGFFCAKLQKDPLNCGVCGHKCPFLAGGPHQFSDCVKGICETSCEAGWGDCNNNPADGCETRITTDAANCGACGHQCDAASGQPCVAGVCLTKPCEDDGGTTK